MSTTRGAVTWLKPRRHHFGGHFGGIRDVNNEQVNFLTQPVDERECILHTKKYTIAA